MRRSVLLLISLILLFSCEKKGYELDSARLTLLREDKKESLTFTVFPSDENLAYYALIKSPGEMLSWSGKMEKDETGAFSISLEITEGASFPQGSYSYKVHSSSGMETDGTLDFKCEEFDVFLLDGIIQGVMKRQGLIGTLSVEIGSKAEEGDVLVYEDEYFNTYIVTL